MYLLDSDICIYLLNNKAPEIERRFRQRIESNLKRLRAFFYSLNSLVFDDRCAEEYGIIRADLAAQGNLIGPNDLIIAAIARAHDAIIDYQ